MSGVIGNSGFECVVTGFRTGKHGGSGKRGTIKNIKTGESIGAVAGQRKCPRRGDCWGYKTGTKTFYGLDDRYYHVIATWNTVKWGQVQSTGAVIDSKRSVITVLDFYPIYIQKPEPVLAKASAPVQPVKVSAPVIPKIKSFKEAEEVYVPKEDSWLEKLKRFLSEKGSLINWIKKLFRPK